MRERERARGKGEEERGEEEGFEILQGLPRQPSKRVTELSICMNERCRFADSSGASAMRINIQSAHDRLRFRFSAPLSLSLSPSVAYLSPSHFCAALFPPPPPSFVFNSLYSPSFSRCLARILFSHYRRYINGESRLIRARTK